jgi:predicted nucleotidyltransferase
MDRSSRGGRVKPLAARRVAPERTEPQDALLTALSEIVVVLDRAGVDQVLIGGLAVSVHGRPRYSRDVDVLVRHVDADRALAAAGEAGFETNPINPHWLYKAFKHDVQVDLIFKCRGDIYLDDEMVRRSARHGFRGVEVPVVPAEDLLVIKALAHDEETPRHWWDALSILCARELDWDYVVERAVKGPHRVLALLHYARSLGILVPATALRELTARVFRHDAAALDG